MERLDVSGLVPVERAARVFEFVRDEITYDFLAKLKREEYEASYTLRVGQGFCTQKAVLLAALGRGAGIPTALVLTDLRDNSLPERVVRAMGGSNLFEYHGLVAFHLGGRWVKADATLSPDVVRRRRYRPVEFNGRQDALLAATTLEGKPHIRYESVRGVYADLPFDEMVRVLEERFQRIDVEALAAMRYKI
jgi:transglutaminase-like putative cysteine protease